MCESGHLNNPETKRKEKNIEFLKLIHGNGSDSTISRNVICILPNPVYSAVILDIRCKPNYSFDIQNVKEMSYELDPHKDKK